MALAFSVLGTVSCDSVYRTRLSIQPEVIQSSMVKIENENDKAKVRNTIEKYLEENKIEFTCRENPMEPKGVLLEYHAKNISMGMYVKQEQADIIIEYVEVNGYFPKVLFERLEKEFEGRIKILKSGIGIFYW